MYIFSKNREKEGCSAKLVNIYEYIIRKYWFHQIFLRLKRHKLYFIFGKVLLQKKTAEFGVHVCVLLLTCDNLLNIRHPTVGMFQLFLYIFVQAVSLRLWKLLCEFSVGLHAVCISKENVSHIAPDVCRQPHFILVVHRSMMMHL